jgi:hypothetical protein
MNKKIIALLEFTIIFISIFSFAYLFSKYSLEITYEKKEITRPKFIENLVSKIKTPIIPTVSAIENVGCCAKNSNGERCVTSLKNECIAEFAEGSLCPTTSFCQKGCCYDPKLGIYDKNALRSDCRKEWAQDPNCNIPGSEKGCCVLGKITIFQTLGQCETDTKIRAMGTSPAVDWRKINELQCAIISAETKEGACVLVGGSCKFTTEVECLGQRGKFSEGLLCTSKSLNTICEKTTQTTCVKGKDGVYFIDSCKNPANIYDYSKINDQNYWERVVPLEQSCSPSSGNANSKTCGNCNRFLGGFCDSAAANRFTVESGNFFCRSTSCTFKGQAYKNGESWCVYDGKIGDGDDIVGSRHWRYVCASGEVKVEPCADARNQICIQSNTFEIDNKEIQFRSSSCVANNWRECVTLNSEEDGLEKCAETLNCKIHSVDIDRKFKFDACVPKYPAGFDLRSERYQATASSICGMASQKCTVVRQPKLTGGCEIKYNENCLKAEFGEKMNDFCRSLGDCGGSVNIVGEYSENYKIRRSPKLSITYINNLKKLASPVPGQIAEVEDYTEYLKAAGIIGGPGDGENYNIGDDFTKVGMGIAGIGYASILAIKGMALYAGLEAVSLSTAISLNSMAASLAPFAGAAIGAGIGLIAGAYLAKVLKLAPMGSILMSIGGGLVGVAAMQILNIIQLGSWFGPLLLIGFALIIISFFFGGSSCKPRVVEFECLPYQPPRSGSDCEKCNNDPLKPCSEYRCQSLGTTCEIVNKGTSNEMCTSVSPTNTNPPRISPQYGVISENEKYDDIKNSGFKISPLSGRCIDSYTELIFGVTTDKLAQCVFDIEPSDFSEMTPMGGNHFKYNHTLAFLLPDPSHGQSQGGNWTGELTFYIKCRDVLDKESPGLYTVNLCVNEGPDRTAPRIREIEPDQRLMISTDKTEVKAKIITNELSTCRWDASDKQYADMINQMTCEDDLFDPSHLQGYLCETTFQAPSHENTFYIRCMDQPWLEEEGRGHERNPNEQSTIYTIKKPQSKIQIDQVLPNEDFKSSTERTTINLQISTSSGGDYHKCSYSLSGYERMIEMWDTGGKVHKQPDLNLISSYNKIFVQCTDETGDIARAETEFTITYDSSSPVVSRIWREANALHFITNEKAECFYSDKSCLVASDGQKTQLGEKHTISTTPGKTYYIKCVDEFKNAPAGCSIVITPV